MCKLLANFVLFSKYKLGGNQVRIRTWLSIILFMLFVAPIQASEQVDLEIVLLADASTSIDENEILFQRKGYADALVNPQVLSAIRSGFLGKIAVTYVEWGDASSQEVVVPWTIIEGLSSAEKFGTELMNAPRLAFGRNAIGSAITRAHYEIESNEIDGIRKVIDFSGDSAFSAGGVPVQSARQLAISQGIVINALAILCRDCSGRPGGYNLEESYANQIIGGPGSFVVTADGRERFAHAVRKKLILEIAVAE